MPKFIVTVTHTSVWQLDRTFDNYEAAEAKAKSMRRIFRSSSKENIAPGDFDHETIDFDIERIEDDD